MSDDILSSVIVHSACRVLPPASAKAYACCRLVLLFCTDRARPDSDATVPELADTVNTVVDVVPATWETSRSSVTV